jgi:hypothetical protein
MYIIDQNASFLFLKSVVLFSKQVSVIVQSAQSSASTDVYAQAIVSLLAVVSSSTAMIDHTIELPAA